MTGPPELIVIGSLNTDLLVRVPALPGPGETVTGGAFEMSGGGKGANQAVAAARAGASVAMVGAVGADEFGERLLEELAGEGVDVSGVARLVAAPTGLAAIVVDERGENQIAVASGANHALGAQLVERAFGELDLGRARCALLSLEVPDAVVVEGATRAAQGGMTVVVNPAPARPLPRELVELRPVLTPNVGEAAELTGRDDPAEAAAALVEAGAAAALVTAGAEGVFVAAAGRAVDGRAADGRASERRASEGRAQRLPAPAVEVRDTTGAGDTFSGVLAAGLARGWELERAARRAVAAAALSVTRSGARGGMPRESEIEAV